MLKFYDFPMAPSPRRARIILREKGIDHETQVVDLSKGEQLSEAFMEINPRCTVPALDLGNGTVLCDNASILAYLEAEYPNPPLCGTTPIEKALVAEWIGRCEYDGLLAVGEALRNSAPMMKGRAVTGPDSYDQIPELAERGRARLVRFWDQLEERLKGRAYVATDDFTAADITALVAVDFARVIKAQPSKDHVETWRWRKAMDERHSVSA